MSRVFLFALTAALNPTLLAATTVMLLLARPRRLLLGYLLGAYTTSITVGLADEQVGYPGPRLRPGEPLPLGRDAKRCGAGRESDEFPRPSLS